MLVVNVDKINMFRRCVSFDAFIKLYSSVFYSFQISEDNTCLLAKRKFDSIECAIFIFEKPNEKIIAKYSNFTIYVYYIGTPRKEDRGIIKEKLSSEYIHEIVKVAETGFSILNKNNILIRLFSKSEKIDTNEIFYKYYNDNMRDKNILNEILSNGLISFSNPQNFNDPFDCDCVNEITGESKNMFKVLCLTPDYTNILMWSYYGNNHKGYCLGYNKNILLNELSERYSGICFIGKVSYRQKRPSYRIKKALGLMDTILFYIKCLFVKFFEWSHENEYRMVIISPPDDKNDYFSFNTTVMARYAGCENKSKSLPPQFTKLVKDLDDYMLK